MLIKLIAITGIIVSLYGLFLTFTAQFTEASGVEIIKPKKNKLKLKQTVDIGRRFDNYA
jgi:hypothetical protein